VQQVNGCPVGELPHFFDASHGAAQERSPLESTLQTPSGPQSPSPRHGLHEVGAEAKQEPD
jgi:hypothetical protein